jgi:hypothetical protein
VETQKMMLGTFSPQLEPYVYEGEEETTPAGIFARGSYSAKLKVSIYLINHAFFLMVIEDASTQSLTLCILSLLTMMASASWR